MVNFQFSVPVPMSDGVKLSTVIVLPDEKIKSYPTILLRSPYNIKGLISAIKNFKEDLPVNEPISPYAASKKGAEMFAYTYHFLYGIDITVLRFFTVYGPAGRPDMSIFRFIKWIDEGVPIELFGDGSQSRDFTYIDDIAEGTKKAFEVKTGHEIINLGGNKPFDLNYAIELIENNLSKKAKRDLKPFHKADIKATSADITKAQKILKWTPEVTLEEGIRMTVEWYLDNKQWLKDIQL